MSAPTHVITKQFGGSEEMAWVQNVCSCGFIGKKFYNWQDYRNYLCREEGKEHKVPAAAQPDEGVK